MKLTAAAFLTSAAVALVIASPAVAANGATAPTDHAAKLVLEHAWHKDHVHVWNCRRGATATKCRDKTMFEASADSGPWTPIWIYATDSVTLKNGRYVVSLGRGEGSLSVSAAALS